MWALVLASVARVTLFSYRRAADAYEDINLSALLAIGLTVGGLAAIALAPAAARPWSLVRLTSSRLLYVYYAFCALSALWSVSPAFSLYRAVEALTQISLVTMGVYFTRRLATAERVFFVGAMVVALMSLLGKLRFYSFEPSLTSLHSNQYPVIAAATAVYCLGEYSAGSGTGDSSRARRLRNWGLAFAILVPLGSSAGTMVAVVAGVLALGMLQRLDRRILVAGALVLLAVFYSYGISRGFWWNVLFQGKEYEDVAQLSGRRSLFEAYLDAAREKPLLGYGFAVAARIGDRFGAVPASHAHNGFLEMLLGGGVIGLFLGLRWLYRLLGEVMRSLRGRPPGVVGFAAAFVVVSVNNLSITIYGGAWNLTLTYASFLLAMFCLFIREGSQAPVGTSAQESSPVSSRPR